MFEPEPEPEPGDPYIRRELISDKRVILIQEDEDDGQTGYEPQTFQTEQTTRQIERISVKKQSL